MLIILVYAIKKGVRTCFHQRGIRHTDEYILCLDLQRRRTHILLLCMSAFSNILQTHLEGVVQSLPLKYHRCFCKMVLINCASTKWKGNLFGDISHLREEGNCADVRLVAGAGSTVSLAHSLVLAAARSDANNQHICALNIVYSKLEIELFSPCLRKALTSLPPSETDVLILVPDASQREV